MNPDAEKVHPPLIVISRFQLRHSKAGDMGMTREQIERLATEAARSLNCPWDANALETKSWRLWPLRIRVWQVRSRVASDGAVATMRINDWTGKVFFGRVLYPAGGDISSVK
jgi:hypothetical protein